MDQLKRRFKDRRLLNLFEKLLDTYHKGKGKGLPIGNLVSQHLANFYLGVMDHWLKEVRHLCHYLRYMDDFILFANEKEPLRQELGLIRQWLAEHLKLRLKDKILLNRTGHGIPFLGYRVFPGEIRLSAGSKKRFVRKYRQYERNYVAGAWDEATLVSHMEPLLDFTRLAQATAFRRKMTGAIMVPMDLGRGKRWGEKFFAPTGHGHRHGHRHRPRTTGRPLLAETMIEAEKGTKAVKDSGSRPEARTA